MTHEQRARLEAFAADLRHDLQSTAWPELHRTVLVPVLDNIAAALAHIDALEARVGEAQAEASMHYTSWQEAEARADALAAERDALLGQATEWKRLYEGAKLRGDRWMADAKQAEPIAAAISAFVQEEGDISVRWVFAPGVSVFSECGDAHKKWHGLVQQVVFLVDGLLRRQQEAEREREEARALVRHLQSELRAEVDGCKEAERTAAERDAAVTTWEAAARSWELRAEQAERDGAGWKRAYHRALEQAQEHIAAKEQAERTAAALREALCRHGIHDVTCAKRRSLFTLYEAVPCDCGFDTALAPTKAHDFECGLTQGQVPYCTCGLDLTPSAAPGEGE